MKTQTERNILYLTWENVHFFSELKIISYTSNHIMDFFKSDIGVWQEMKAIQELKISY